MNREVLLTFGAERDLESIVAYISEVDGPLSTEHVLKRLLRDVEDLPRFPDRGRYPRELSNLGIREYRQVLFKPYRIIYRKHERRVVVYVIADGHVTCRRCSHVDFLPDDSFRASISHTLHRERTPAALQ